MADQFDAVDIIYDIIKDCFVKPNVYKDKAPSDVVTTKVDHVVIASLTNVEGNLVNVIPVNLNGYFAKTEKGMIDRDKLKSFKNQIDDLLENAIIPVGFYCVIERSISNIFTDLESGFDCMNIRLELTLNS